LEIIEGREVHLATIEKFKLDTIYKRVKYKELLLKRFGSDINIMFDELTGVISCSYEAKNKVLARDLVRFLVEEANEKYVRLKKERALQTIEQLNSFKQSIIASADSLSEVMIKFYRDNNLLHLETQLQLTISAIVGYEEQIKNLKISESKAGSDNSTAAELRKRRAILEREVQKLRGEFTKEYLPNRQSVYVNSDWAVEKIIEHGKLESDLKRFFLTLEMIESNIVMEEANAARNLPVIQIIQDAYLPDYKSKPKRAIWAIVAFALVFLSINSLFIIRAIYTGELKHENQETFRNLIKSLKI
jgi:cell division protein FtsB